MQPVAEGVDLVELHPRVQQDDRERHVAEESFANHPQQGGAVLADRPQHGERRGAREGLTQNKDRSRFEYV
jgi:hypothetical protein